MKFDYCLTCTQHPQPLTREQLMELRAEDLQTADEKGKKD